MDSQETVFTLKRILSGDSEVTFVTRDQDGSWQFLDGQPAKVEDAAIVGFQQMMEIDETLKDLKDLSLGQRAYRKSRELEWNIS